MADDNVSVAQLRARIEDSLRNPMNASSPQLKAAMQAIVKYQKLVELLRAEYPTGFMTQPPEGYIASRADQPAPPQFQAPGNIVFVPIDRSTGAATTQESAATITETFIAGTEPGGLNRAQPQQP